MYTSIFPEPQITDDILCINRLSIKGVGVKKICLHQYFLNHICYQDNFFTVGLGISKGMCGWGQGRGQGQGQGHLKVT